MLGSGSAAWLGGLVGTCVGLLVDLGLPVIFRLTRFEDPGRVCAFVCAQCATQPNIPGYERPSRGGIYAHAGINEHR
jgi:hypothetical protein